MNNTSLVDSIPTRVCEISSSHSLAPQISTATSLYEFNLFLERYRSALLMGGTLGIRILDSLLFLLSLLLSPDRKSFFFSFFFSCPRNLFPSPWVLFCTRKGLFQHLFLLALLLLFFPLGASFSCLFIHISASDHQSISVFVGRQICVLNILV